MKGLWRYKLSSALLACCSCLGFVLQMPFVVSMVAAGWILSAACAGVIMWIWLLVTKHEGFSVARSCAWGISLAAVVSAMMGLLQYSGWAVTEIPWVAASLNNEAYANLRQRNQLATLLVMGSMILVWQLPSSSVPRSLLLWLLIGMLMTCLAATASRTGVVQLGSLLICVIAGHRHFPQGLLRASLCAIALYLAALLLMPSFSEALGHSNIGLLSRLEDTNAFSRFALWSNVLELIAEQPWTGHGWRSLAYAHYSTEFISERFMEMLDNAHNLPLHLAVELGVPVALLFCVAVAWFIWRGKPWAEKRAEHLMAWGFLLVIGIHSMVEYPLWYGPFFLTSLLCVMILLQDWVRNLMENCSSALVNSARYATKFIACIFLAFAAYAAFDYHRVSQIYLQPEDRVSWYADDALGAAKQSVLFKNHAKFAELVITPLSQASAPRLLQLSSELVHWSPEPRVIEKLIESATLLGLDDIATFHLRCYRNAYPQAYAIWAARNART